MKGIGAVVLILVVPLAAGSYWVTRAPSRGLTTAELTWVSDFIEWRDVHWDRLFDAYEAIDADLTSWRVDIVFRPIKDCSRSYSKNVGTAPDKLSSVEDATQDACTRGQRAIHEFDSSGLSALRMMKEHLLDGHQALMRGASRLDELLIMTMPLPELVV